MSNNRRILADYIKGVRTDRNYIINSDAEKNLKGITDADAIVTRSTSSPISGDASFVIDADASGEKALFLAKPLETELHGQTCEASFVYSGDASLYKFYVQMDAAVVSDDAFLNNVTAGSQKAVLVFPCGESLSAVPSIVIEATDNAATAVKIDSLFLGRSSSVQQVSQARLVGSIQWALTTNCNWQTTSTSFAVFADDAQCDDNARVLTQLAGDPTAGLKPAISFPYQGPGEYVMVATGAFYKSAGATAEAYFRAHDGTNAWSTSLVGSNLSTGGTVFVPSITSRYTYVTPPASRIVTLNIQSRTSNASSAAGIDSTTDGALNITVYYYPTAQQTAVVSTTQDLSGTFVYTGNASCQWTSTSATMASFSADSDCASTAAAGNAIAPATVVPGFRVPTLLPGRYKITATGFILASESSSGTAACNFELYDGATSKGIVLLNTQVSKGNATTSMIEGVFEYTSVQTNKQFEIRARRASGNGSCAIDASAADLSQLSFSVTPISQALPKPFIPGSVYLGRHNQVKMGIADLSCNASSTINTNVDGMVSAIGNRSNPACVVTLTTGYFSSTPNCWQAVRSTAVSSLKMVSVVEDSATQVTIRAAENTSGTYSDYRTTLYCIG